MNRVENSAASDAEKPTVTVNINVINGAIKTTDFIDHDRDK